MAKFYVQSGKFRGIVDSHNAETAAQWAVHQAMRQIIPLAEDRQVTQEPTTASWEETDLATNLGCESEAPVKNTNSVSPKLNLVSSHEPENEAESIRDALDFDSHEKISWVDQQLATQISKYGDWEQDCFSSRGNLSQKSSRSDRNTKSSCTILVYEEDMDEICIHESAETGIIALAETISVSERGFDAEDQVVVDTFIAFQQWNQLFQAIETLDRTFESHRMND